jgi:septal ring factor EnvC (AmiA/AmiB activator)
MTPGDDLAMVTREVIVSNTSTQIQQRGGFIPAEFLDDVDVAECALDDQIEQLHRQYAAASRALSGARFEQEILEARDDIHAPVLAQARRQRAAAETRCARLVRAIDALEERLERSEDGE